MAASVCKTDYSMSSERSNRSTCTRFKCAGKVALAYTLVLGTSRGETLGSSNLPARTKF